MSTKSFLIIGGVILFIALIAWTIYEMKNAYELPPDEPNFLIHRKQVYKRIFNNQNQNNNEVK